MKSDVELAAFLLNRVQFEKLDSDFDNYSRKNFKENLLEIFQALENKIIIFVKNELERFKKILKKENTQYFVEDFIGDMCSIKEAALDLTLYFLKYMKQDEAANILRDALVFIHQQRLISRLTKKYESVSEGIAKHGDSTLLNNIYTDLYITQGCSEQINTEHEVRQIEVASRYYEFQEIQIKCTNLFESTEQDKQIRTVLTKGVAGIGKSVSVQKVILDWAKRLEKDKKEKDKKEKDKREKDKMNLIEKEKQSLMDLITQFFPETKGLNLTKSDQFKVLFILDGCVMMYHFCWISATVLQNILEEKRNKDVRNNQADDVSKTQQKSNTEDTPKTLTQMYTHFLRFQILQNSRKYDGKCTLDVSWDKDAIFSLGKLAFHQLEMNNLIFCDADMKASGIDVSKASMYSGMCTQIFKEETGIIVGTMYCFVHLSIQEFIAALYAHLFLDINKKSVFVQDSAEQENKSETMIDLLKTAVDKALESDNGQLDLFLRFLLGLSLQSNQRLLRGLLTQQDDNDQIKEEIVQYIKQKLEANLSPERSINLFYCLNELNDQTLVKDIQTHLREGSLSSVDLSPAQWSALAFVLLTSEEEMEEFELQKFKKSDECLVRLSAVIKTCKRAL
ncbi:NACHT, LRR and PYD domains-containing protein 3-like [Sinocyclocheilus rhinocerous]|uniref:NACHT, LRR and PYD domains-containing protein 3-like n=1 Tax=Sinocyclocheilus rhinocerous TaxID=307959 RepID=UPI0007B941D4|nr:PREDICTED: NACHT, LRR and PYD domains-containing protein 3-like [Sinocyclocheilus rhinocerous]